MVEKSKKVNAAIASDNTKAEIATADNYQMKCGVTLGVLAAILAINSISTSRNIGTGTTANQEKGTAYAWYQSKSIKASITEGHRDNVAALLKTSEAKGAYKEALEKDLGRLNNTLNRYEKEKMEILQGSAAVGEENWSIQHRGKMGQVKGAEEWERDLELSGKIGDVFDMAAMFLHLSVVFGSVSLLLNRVFVRNAFYSGMVGLGIVGTGFFGQALILRGIF